MRVLFLYPNVSRYPAIPIGVGSLIAALQGKGHEWTLFDATFYDDDELMRTFIDYVRISSCEMLAIHCTSCDWRLVQILLAGLQEGYPENTIIKVIGGPHPTSAPDEVIDSGLVDVVTIGEGEETINELVERVAGGRDISLVENCWIKTNGRINKNRLRPLIDDLDSLPIPAWEIFDDRHVRGVEEDPKGDSQRIVGIETSRGCPYSCTYCVNSHLRTIYKDVKGKFCREKSANRVIAESRSAKERVRADFIKFVDDNFMGPDKRLVELSKRFPVEVGLPLHLQVSADKVNRRTIRLMAEMGVVRLGIGVETGNEIYRKKILTKFITNEQIVEAFRLAREYGIATKAYYMIGLPFDRREYIEQTIEFNELAKPDITFVSTYFPFPGTILGRAVLEKNLVEHYEYLPDFYRESILKFDDLAAEDLQDLRRRFANVTLNTGPFERRDLERLTGDNYSKTKPRKSDRAYQR